jgi:ABC-type cobalamin/Fe3+-siderophores transport system ATPase subunit
MNKADGRLIGVTAVGPVPVGVAHLPAEVGVSVIYGKNGAGKTRLLGALSAALRGEAPGEGRVFLHWAVEDAEDMHGGWRETLSRSLSQAYQDDRGRQLAELLRKRDQSFGSDREDWERENIANLFDRLQEEEFSPTTLAEVIFARYRDAAELLDMELPEYGRLPDGLAARVVLGGQLVFEAVGVPGEPAWSVYSALDLSHDHVREQVALDVERHANVRRIAGLFRNGEMTAQEVVDEFMAKASTELSDIPWVPTEDGNDEGQGLVLSMVDYGLEDWPRWASVPLHQLGTIHALPLAVTNDDGGDISVKTREHLVQAAGGQVIAAMDGDDVLLSDALEQCATQLQDRANQLLRRLMPQGPTLQFELTNPNRWFTHSLPTWSAVVPDGEISLERLSEAERKWSQVAISLAMATAGVGPDATVVILDEPEQGLHGHAEARLSDALAQISRESQCMVVAATHSAALLNAPAADKHHLSARVDGQVRSLRKIDADLARSFRDVRYGEQEVGLTPAEILQMVRLFVVVEGTHDQVVLEHLLASDLSAAGAVILCAFGAKNLPELTRAQLIWDYTDADVIVVLDGMSVDAVLPLWEQAKEAARSGNKRKAAQALRALEQLPGGEPVWLRELLQRALDTGHWERVHPHPLSMPDIVCYLPPDALGLDSVWDDVIQNWRSAAGRRAPVDLKGWVKKNYGISLSLKTLRRALQEAVPVREIQDLGLEIRVLSGMRDVDAKL